MNKRIGEAALDRRQMLQLGLGAAGGLMLPGLGLIPARAAEAPLGTWPAGVSGSTVFVGVTSPLTGAYSADGKDEVLGYELAFAEINAGGANAQAWGLKGKGVLGKQIRHAIADSELKPNVAVQAQTQFIQRDKAMMITGCVSSAEAVALEELAQREHVLNMVGAAGANAATGHDCQRYAFRSQPSAYMACKALAPVVAQHYGRGKKVAYLVPDYNYGHSVFGSFSAFTKPYGWTTAAKEVVPLSATDYSSALLNIANSGADIFVNIEFAAQAVNSTKQAAQFGVFKKMQMIVPNISSFQAQETGAALMGGVFGTMDWNWKLEDRFPLAKSFVAAFQAKNHYTPNWGANIGYLQTYIWALGVERAGTFYPPAVIKALEASKTNPFDSTLGKVWYRAEDHQLVRPVPVVLGNAPGAMKTKDDWFNIVDLVPGEQAISPPTFLGCKLGSYT
ncbi:MAG: ABC transporter substrate-binding protein [Proteobacteria bacterium]|nr:ABC transporter substrate-binding protein [Pseudomonadota bacterium]